MQVPILDKLPPSPSDKTGWPWTEGSPKLTDHMTNGNHWPLVSIVTPSYNQGQFIEETIRSVLLQGYPNLEYIIIDGGSTDNSIEIIRKYEPWLAYWVSEPDNGQSDAINKGLQKTTGEYVCWINSDDVYFPNIFRKVIKAFFSHPDISFIYGDIWKIDQNSNLIRHCTTYGEQKDFFLWTEGRGLSQPATFWKRDIHDSIGYLRDDLNFIMDYEFFLRASFQYEFFHLSEPLSKFRLHKYSKTNLEYGTWIKEHVKVSKEYWKKSRDLAPPNYWRRVNNLYGRHLVSEIIRGESSSKHNIIQLNRALLLAPSLFKEKWFYLFWIRELLGKSIYSRIKNLLKRFEFGSLN